MAKPQLQLLVWETDLGHNEKWEGADGSAPSHSVIAAALHCNGCQFGALSVHQDGHEKVPLLTRKLS